jgi:ferredoxin
VCPVSAFREGFNFLAIDPEDCIDCALCVAECPERAIYEDKDVPVDQIEFIALNAALARAWPEISEAKEPLPDAEAWSGLSDKRRFLMMGEFVEASINN